MSTCSSPEQFERLLAGQLSEAEAKAVELHVEGCPRCQEKLALVAAGTAADHWKRLRTPTPGATPAADEDFLRYMRENPPSTPQAAPGTPDGDGSATIQFPGPPTALGPLGQLESYHIRKELGQGSYGIVYQAYDALDRLVAIKILKPEFATSPKERARFAEEARAGAAVKHDHVITIYQIGDTPDFPLPYLVMEYVEGEALSDQIRRKELPAPQEAARLVRQVALGVGAAHERGLLHRDIKPSNILLEQTTRRAKITDFGLACALEESSARVPPSERMAGTLAYMCPEQIVPPHRPDRRSDVYSLGVVLYELLTGERPFHGVKHMVLQQIVHEEPRQPRKLNDQVPRDLETITLKCLAKEAKRRYQTAQELADDLQRWLDGEPIQARPVSKAERVWRWCRRQPVVASLAAALMIAVVSGLAAVTWEWRAARQAQAEEAKHRNVAEKQRELALQSLNRLVFDVQRKLRDQPQMQTLRRSLLQTALDGLKQIAEEYGSETDVDRTEGTAYANVAEVAQDLGQTDEAAKWYSRACVALERLVAVNPQDVASKHNLAMAYVGLGDVQLQQGHLKAAREYFGRSLELRKQLNAAGLQSAEAIHFLVVSYDRLGDTNLQLGDSQAARSHYDQSLKLREQVWAAAPNDAEALRGLSISHDKIGEVSLQTNDLPLARTSFEQSLKFTKQWQAADPNNPLVKDGLMCSYFKLGRVGQASNDFQAAQANYAQAVKLCKELQAADPQQARWKSHLAIVYGNIGDVSVRFGDRQGAQEAYTQAVKIGEELQAADPHNALARTGLAQCYGALGDLAMQMDAYKEAIAMFERGIAILQELDAKGQYKDEPGFRPLLRWEQHKLAICKMSGQAIDDLDFALAQPPDQARELLGIRSSVLASRGQHLEAALTADKLHQLAPERHDNLYNVASCFALCIPAVTHGKKPDQITPDEQALQRRYMARALQLLVQAIDHGFKDVIHLEANSDLGPLRQQAAYRALVERLRKP